MIIEKKNLERGQSLIVATMLLLAFIALLAVVLDGGFTYWQRRNAQNAADAGALAGVDELCRGINEGKTPSEIEAQAEAKALEFAVERNGVNNSNITTTATAVADYINIAGGTVTVNANINFKSFFGRVLGLDFIDAPGYAKAGCAPPEGISVMPVAWSCKSPIGEVPDPLLCEVQKVLPEDLPCAWGDDPMYIIADSVKIEVDIVCQDPITLLPEGQVDCDLDDNLVNDDVILLSGGDRAWLDLNGDGGGAAELKDWIKGDYEDLWVGPHFWVPVQTGVTASVYDTVFDYIMGDKVVMPIFDDFCPDGYPPKPGCSPLHTFPPRDDVVVGDDPQDYYHIKAFSYWVTTCVDSGSHKGPCDVRTWLEGYLRDILFWSEGDINSLQTMEGCFVSGSVPGLGGTPGQGVATGLYSIFLME